MPPGGDHHQGKQTVIEKRADGGWGLASMHDYPVQETKLRGVLTGLTELRLTELGRPIRLSSPGWELTIPQVRHPRRFVTDIGWRGEADPGGDPRASAGSHPGERAG